MTDTTSHVTYIDIDAITHETVDARFDADDDQIPELADSIRQLGVLEPVVVTQTDDGYRLIAGRRRCRAARMAGLTRIPAHVVTIDESRVLDATFVENFHRRELNPLEQAVYLRQLLDTQGVPLSTLAARLGVSQTWLSRRLQLLDADDVLQDGLVDGTLSPAVVHELMRLPDQAERRRYADLIRLNGATVSTVRSWVAASLAYAAPAPAETQTESPPEPTEYRVAAPTGPACHACGAQPPQAVLKAVYLCWGCAQALESARETEARDE